MSDEPGRRRLNRKVDRRGAGEAAAAESPSAAAESESKPAFSSSSPNRPERGGEAPSPVRFSADSKNDENVNTNSRGAVSESKPSSSSSAQEDDAPGGEGRSRLRRNREAGDNTTTAGQAADSAVPAPSSAPAPPQKPARNIFRPTNPPPRNDKLIKREHVAAFPYSLFNRTLPGSMGYRMGNLMSARSAMNSRSLYNKEATAGWGLGINVMDILPCGELMSLVRPFVRVHAVNINSGMCIKSPRKGATRSVATRSVLLRDSNSFPRWDQQLVLDADFADIAAEECLLIFELLDEKPSLKVVTGGKSRASKRIAWGFLLPLSNSNKSANVALKNEWLTGGGQRQRSPRGDETGQMLSPDEASETAVLSSSATAGDQCVRIQLYASTDDDSIVGYMQRQAMGWRPYSSSSAWNRDDPAFPDDVCEAYIQWRKQSRQKLSGGCLCVALGPRHLDQLRSAGDATVTDGPASVSLSRQLTISGMGGVGSASDSVAGHQSKEAAKMRSAILRRSRAPKEPCVVPDKLLRRIDAGPDGAMVVKYSNCGHVLAIASRTATVSPAFSEVNSPTLSPSYVYGLRLYDTDADGEVWAELGAHHSTVYDVQWSESDAYIVTCSGDGTCKIWDVRCLLGRAADKSAAADSELPYLLQTLECHPPVFVYSAIFQEYGRAVSQLGATTVTITTNSFDGGTPKDVPRVICGASDGKIRVFEGGKIVGKIASSDPGDDNPPHSGRVNALCIDKRSKYLMSGCSDGEILVWRLDRNGWYSPLRKFKKDGPAGMLRINSTSTLNNGGGADASSGIISLATHPDKARGQLLALSQPFNLRLYNMNTYKVQSQYPAMSHAKQQQLSFCRAGLSADGSFAVSQIAGADEEGKDGYSLLFWHSQTGAQAFSPLSKMVFPFPVRCVSWHPNQHCLAVCMVGEGSSVLVYSGSRESAERAIMRQGMMDAHALLESVGEGGSSIVDVNQSVYTEGKSLYPLSGLGDTSSVIDGLRMAK